MAREPARLLRLLARRRARAQAVGTLTRPVDGSTSLHRRGAAPELRLLLFGSGPAAGWGVHLHDLGLGGGIADGIAERTGRAVTMDLLVDDTWDDPDAITALRAQGLSTYDAVVVIGAYRPALLEIPLAVWQVYLDRLRTTLLEEAGPDVVLQVLALNWDDAVSSVPEVWGGAFGRLVVDLAHVADESFQNDDQVLRLQLLPPVEPTEWIGPDFSVASYARWSAAACEQLAPLLQAAPPPTAR